jgi:MmyB-like transcription regulator ligand binding domain/Helix-turn-helix domain
VDNRAEIREFLTTRRARITPQQAGLAADAGVRRVPGLRREEVAVLAGVSTDWYVRLEKGHMHQSGTKYFHHPVVGDVEVSFDSMELPADPGLTLTVYATEPGTPLHDALATLASWKPPPPASASRNPARRRHGVHPAR